MQFIKYLGSRQSYPTNRVLSWNPKDKSYFNKIKKNDACVEPSNVIRFLSRLCITIKAALMIWSDIVLVKDKL
jgi:hypothetical protein